VDHVRRGLKAVHHRLRGTETKLKAPKSQRRNPRGKEPAGEKKSSREEHGVPVKGCEERPAFPGARTGAKGPHRGREKRMGTCAGKGKASPAEKPTLGKR